MPPAIQQSAAERVASVRDDPEGRYQLRVAFYEKYGFSRDGGSGYGASELEFLRWEIDRGVLNPLDHATRPGSRWWREVNDDFLLAGEQAADVAEGLAPAEQFGEPVEFWLEYFRRPSRQAWYRAHNGSIAAGYLARGAAAGNECSAEQIFLNMVLYRLLYAQALVEGEAPGILYAIVRRLFGHAALLDKLESLIADPRGPSVDVLVHLPDFYPRHYPLSDDDIRSILDKSHGPEQDAVELMDRVLISPYLGKLYRLAAGWLSTPRLCELVHDGRPCYPVHGPPAVLPGSG
jgi:hypothetical protein